MEASKPTFTKLSPELRLQIYDEHFSNITNKIKLHNLIVPFNKTQDSTIQNLTAVLYTNKTIFNEAAPILARHQQKIIDQLDEAYDAAMWSSMRRRTPEDGVDGEEWMKVVEGPIQGTQVMFARIPGSFIWAEQWKYRLGA